MPMSGWVLHVELARSTRPTTTPPSSFGELIATMGGNRALLGWMPGGSCEDRELRLIYWKHTRQASDLLVMLKPAGFSFSGPQ